MTKLMIKDNTMKDFTMDKSTDPFMINYPKHGGVRLLYENFDPSTGCKDITLYGGKDSSWRIWVSD
ncbi:related to Mig1 protein, induced during biotrophic phase [Ustilago sp. UG-2017b]|nr:related to Mig1 protein, induced during biotrophic phase [Ustilago sp. UG-2017b]